MCRCLQRCWEDIYWNCFEEKFCFDPSIANYMPEDDDYIVSEKNDNIIAHIQGPVVDQPSRIASLYLNSKIHEEDYRRETQTNVPMLGPEILAVFANSQIFQDHQPTKQNRLSSKAHLTAIHSPSRAITNLPNESEQDRLLHRLEGKQNGTNNNELNDKHKEYTKNPKIFTVAAESSPEGSQILSSSKKLASFPEEEVDENDTDADIGKNEVILRPRLIDRHPHLLLHGQGSTPKTLRPTKSVPYFNVRAAASETDIFSITGSGQISMTPEVPSISFSHLPKNYENTPTIEEYRVSQSLYSIQTANAARVSQDDFSMPKYFRRSGIPSHSTEVLHTTSSNEIRRPEKEKSKRLQMLRSNLPPLMIHSVSFRKNRDDKKQLA